MRATYVRCSAAAEDCERANYGVGCHHRKPHRFSNNCRMSCALDSGLRWCNFRKFECKCEALEAEKGNNAG